MKKRASYFAVLALACLVAGPGCSRSRRTNAQAGGEGGGANPVPELKLRATVDGCVGPVAFSGDGKFLAVGGTSQGAPAVKLVEVATGKERATLKRPAGKFAGSLAFSGDDKLLATSWERGEDVVLWDVAAVRQQAVLKAWPFPGIVNHVAFSPDGRLLAGTGHDEKETGAVKLWDVATGAEVATLPDAANHVTALEFSGDGKLLATVAYDKKLGYADPKVKCTVKLWDVAAAKERETFTGPADGVGEPGRIVVAAVRLHFSGDGKLLALGRWDQTVKLWDVATGQARATFKGHTGWVVTAVLSGDGRRLASGSFDGTVKLWDATTGVEQASVKAHSGWVVGLAFDGAGTLLASAGGTDADSTLKLWEVPGDKSGGK